MKILYIGCVESSYVLLKELIKDGAEICGIITKERSGFNADYQDLAPLALENNIPYVYVEDVNSSQVQAFIKQVHPEIGFCFGWSQLLKDAIIDAFPYGVVGFHPAALPYNKGRHPIIWALVLGLKETASTFFMIDKRADSGDIISQEFISIDYEDDAGSLYAKIMDKAKDQVLQLRRDFEEGCETKVPQAKELGNVWRKRGKKDGEIDWRMSSRRIYNLVRGLTRPYVGAHFVFDDREIKVWKVQEIVTDKYNNLEPGKVLKVTDEYVDIKAGDNVIRILECEDFKIEEGYYL